MSVAELPLLPFNIFYYLQIIHLKYVSQGFLRFGKKILQSVSKQILFPNGDTSDLFYNDKSKFLK